MKHPASNQLGSATLEATASMAFMAFAITSALTLSYFIFARVWLERSTYELIVCLASQGQKSSCESVARKQAATALPIGKIGRLKTFPNQKSITAEIHFYVGGREIFRIKDKRRVPLTSGKRLWSQ